MKNLTANFKKEGITLIELMVAILIIVLIATIGVIAIKNIREKTRDVKRVYDIEQYAKALVLYSQQNPTGNFPSESGYLGKGHSASVNSEISSYIPELPMDPQDPGGIGTTDKYYYYVASNDCYGTGQRVATVHVQKIETSKPEYHNNPCLAGSNEGDANIADYLLILH